MTAQVYLFDHPGLRDLFLPYALSRPLGELRYGAFLLRERWSALLGRPVAGHLAAAHLADFAEPGAAPVVARPGAPIPLDRQLAVMLPGGAASLSRVECVETLLVAHSSSDVRARVAAGHSIRYLVSPAVEAYIRDHRLYRSEDPRRTA